VTHNIISIKRDNRLLRYVVIYTLFLAILSLYCSTVWASETDPSTSRTDKKIALSFDDIPRGPGAFLPHKDRAQILIKALKKSDVDQVVFFLNPAHITKGINENGGNDEANITAYADAGHVLANHTAHHLRLSDVTADEFLANIDQAEVWLQSHYARRPWMRHPYLDEGKSDKAKRDAVRKGLKERSLINGYVTVDASDWHIDTLASQAVAAGKTLDHNALRDLFVESHLQSSNFAHDLSLRLLGRAPVQMMLLHEADVTVMFIADLIKALKNDGWKIVSADEAYADPLIYMQAEEAFATGTLLEMLASDKNISPRWYERNNIKIATKLFNERVLHEKAINQETEKK